jgi:uncharacterized protein YkwD
MRSVRAMAVRACVVSLALSAAVAPPAATASERCADARLQPSPQTLQRVHVAMVCLLNRERSANGLRSLRLDGRLSSSASFHVRDMIASSFFDHELTGHPRLLTRIVRSGYFRGFSDGYYTQNLGYGPEPAGTAVALVDAWMESDWHRRNILDGRFRDVGVGSGLVGPGAPFDRTRPSTVYATDFGRRLRPRSRFCRKRRASRGNNPTALPPRRYCRR